MYSFHDNRFRLFPVDGQTDPDRLTRRVPAVDPQPSVRSLTAGLDLALWLGDGKRRNGSSRADVEHDNTLHAGLALTAVHTFDQLFAEWFRSDEEAADAAVSAYREAAHLDGEEFSAVLCELFAAAMHLMDARNLDLHARPIRDPLVLQLGTMLLSLEHLCTTKWVERLDGERFTDMLAAACAHYWDQLTDVDPDEIEPTEPTRSVAAVWIEHHGEFNRIEWCLDPQLHQDSTGACLYCLLIETDADRAWPCPGLEAHKETQFKKINERLDHGGVEASQFEVPARLTSIDEVLSEIERQIRED
ncbi:hypothetical protein ACVDFE_00115 [Lentzea chajnantorensis]